MPQMVGKEDCPRTQRAKTAIIQAGLWEKVNFIDANSFEGRKLAQQLKTEQVPFFVAEGLLLIYLGEFLHYLRKTSLDAAYGEECEKQ